MRTRGIHVLAGLCGFVAASAGARAPGDGAVRQDGVAISSNRVLKSFDFDEARLGNYETMPIGWRRVEGPGYPRFADIRIDKTGASTAPALRLDLTGGATAAEYVTRTLDVVASCDYEITGSIRVDGLCFASATLEAFYLDYAMREIPGSRRASEAVRAAGGSQSPWARVTVRLRAGVEGARWMGLACAVRSGSAPADSDRRVFPVIRQGVLGGAWFDDIEVTLVPGITLEPVAATGVFVGSPPRLRIGMEDFCATDLATTLTVTDAGGREVLRRPVEAQRPPSGAMEMNLGGLVPGCYTARVEVTGEGRLLAAASRSFACVASEPAPPDGLRATLPRGNPTEIARGIGLILKLPAREELADVLSLIDVLRPAAVKLPLWRADLSDDAVLKGDDVAMALVEGLRQRGVLVVGVLQDTPAGLVAQYDSPRVGLLDVLRGPASVWRPYLALTVTRFGSQVGFWQIGGDDAAPTFESRALDEAAKAVQRELDSLIGAGRLVTPRLLGDARFPSTASDVLVSYQERPQVAARNQRSLDNPRVDWLTVSTPSRLPDDGGADLAEFAQRILLGRCEGARTVWVQQPWHYRKENGWGRLEPTAEFPVVAALGSVLRGCDPLAPVSPGEGVRGWVLQDSSRGTCFVAMWRDGHGAPGDDDAITWDIGEGCQYYDATGRPLAMGRADRGHTLPVGALPSILTGVPGPRVLALARFTVNPALVNAGPRPQAVNLRFFNPHATPLHGLIHLSAPEGWEVSPPVVRVSLGAKGEQATPLLVRVPSNQPSGPVELVGRLEVAGDELDGLVLRAAVDVGSAALDVNVLTRTEGAALRVFHRVTNRTELPLNLRCVLIAPGRAEEQRLIRALGPGQSAVREFVLPDAAALRDRTARVTVEQFDGSIRDNRLIEIRPADPGRDVIPPARSLVQVQPERAAEPSVSAVADSMGRPSR